MREIDDFDLRCLPGGGAGPEAGVRPPGPYLFRGTVLHNAMYGPLARGAGRTAAAEVAAAWLERVGIVALAGRTVDHLSGGERRRLALARALAVHPRLLLLDEPLADLDARVIVASPTPLPKGLAGQRLTLS